MVGKGQRRREKNFRAAHGGYARLPPPPKPNEIDALPSKLRRLIDFAFPPTTTTTTTKEKLSTDPESKKKNTKKDALTAEKKVKAKDDSSSKNHISEENINEGKLQNAKYQDANEETVHGDKSDKKKGKRKRNQVKDLRFDTQELDTYGSKKKERQKKFAEAKKNKHKKAKTEEGPQFPGREKIKFGDVVDAPPKLSSVPKGVKNVQDASHERLRLQAIESYRNRKGWGSRLGIHPPPIVLDPSV